MAIGLSGTLPIPVETEQCDRCRGTGIYQWGASINGRMTHSGMCFACQGKGWQSKDDKARNAAYWRHAIREMI